MHALLVAREDVPRRVRACEQRPCKEAGRANLFHTSLGMSAALSKGTQWRQNNSASILSSLEHPWSHRRAQRTCRAMALLCTIRCWLHVIDTCLYPENAQCQEWTLNHGLWVIMCPQEIITDHKHTTLVGNVDGNWGWGAAAGSWGGGKVKPLHLHLYIRTVLKMPTNKLQILEY